MREIHTGLITEAVKEMCIEANHVLARDMEQVFNLAVKEEESPLGRQVLGQLKENLKIAAEDMIPICQDTGMAVVFIKVGQDVHITGGSLTGAVNEGVKGDMRKDISVSPWLGIRFSGLTQRTTRLP